LAQNPESGGIPANGRAGIRNKIATPGYAW
jgi:hypothetical protein